MPPCVKTTSEPIAFFRYKWDLKTHVADSHGRLGVSAKSRFCPGKTRPFKECVTRSLSKIFQKIQRYRFAIPAHAERAHGRARLLGSEESWDGVRFGHCCEMHRNFPGQQWSRA